MFSYIGRGSSFVSCAVQCGFHAGAGRVRAGTMRCGAGAGWQYLVRAAGRVVTRTLCGAGAGHGCGAGAGQKFQPAQTSRPATGEWAGFVSELVRGCAFFRMAGAVSLSSCAGTGHLDQSCAALALGPPALCIDSWLFLGLSLASFRGGGPFFPCLGHAHILSITQMAMADNSGFTFLLLVGAARKCILSHSS